MPTIEFDTGSDLDGFVKGSDESDSEPERSESEAEYESSDDNNSTTNHHRRRVRVPVPVRASAPYAYVFPSMHQRVPDADADSDGDDSEVDEGNDADEESDDMVDDDSSDDEGPVRTRTHARARVVDSDDETEEQHAVPQAVLVPVEPVAPAPAFRDPSWYLGVVNRHFSTDAWIRSYARSRVVGEHWTPRCKQRVRVGYVRGESAFYAGKEGVVLGPSVTRPGKWRVTVHGSAMETARNGETGVAFHSSELTPTSNLKLHLNAMPTEEVHVLPVLVASVGTATVRAIQRARPFKSWSDLRKCVPSLTDATAALLRDFCAVNMASTNTTWRAFAALGDDYASQLAQWTQMTPNQRNDARDDASERIEAEKAVRRRAREEERTRVRAATEAPDGEPRAQRPRRAAAIAADAIGYREADAMRLRMMESVAWEGMQEE
jgi:hypothetical protein